MNNKLKILIVGGSGREHAIGWKILQSKRCDEIFFAPGNAGTKNIGVNIPIKSTDTKKLLVFAIEEKIDLTIVVAESALSLGIVDDFNKEGLRIFGPIKNASQIGSSKVYAKNFMFKHKISTAPYQTFTDYKTAENYIRSHTFPLVIKIDGLSLGKGIFVCQKLEDALFAVEDILVKKKFGNAGDAVIIEDFLEGDSLSLSAFTDGKNFSIFPISKNYKNSEDNNKGKNTSGIAAICPFPTDDEIRNKIKENIISPTLLEMNNDGNKFSGIINSEIILKSSKINVSEYNFSFTDPETQNFMRLLNTDLLDIIDACIDGNLDQIKIDWFKEVYACTIVVTSLGYPGSYETGHIIDGIKKAEEDENIIIFHSGTTMKDGNLVTSSGKVLGVSAIGETLEKTLDCAYSALEKISFNGIMYRKDIGKEASTR